MKKYKKWILLFLQFPLTRIIIALAVVAGTVQGFQSISNILLGHILNDSDSSFYGSIFSWAASIPLAFIAYYLFVRYYERRSVTELSFTGAWKELGMGSAFGAMLMAIIIGIIWILGDYKITNYNGFIFLILPFFHYAYTAVYEELIFRGILFRIIEKSLGSWVALVISGLIFGFAHSSVPNATLYSNLAIGILGGVIFSAAFMLTKRLWFTIGIHFAWNFTLVGIFGIEVSEKDGPVLLHSELAKSGLVTGGDLGLETSLVTFFVVLIAGFYLLWQSYKKGNYVKTFWKK